MNIKRKLISTAIFILLFFLAYYFVFRDYSITEFQQTLSKCNGLYIVVAMLCVGLWVFLEAYFFKYIFRKLKYKISWHQAIGYVFTETYFSAITPSSTGGQPVQMVEMNKDKIPYRISSIVVIVNTLLYKIALLVIVLLGFFIFYSDIKTLTPAFRGFALLGFIITSLLVALFLCLLFSKKFIMKLVNFGYGILWKLRIKKKDDESQKKLEASIDEYRNVARYIKKDKKTVVKSFLIIFGQRLSLLLVNYFIYKSFNINNISVLFAITIQAYLTIAADFIPVPGGVIISEALLIETNVVLGITDIAKGATLVFRNISFYFLVLVSLVYYMIFHYAKRKPAEKIEEEIKET